MGTIDSNGIWLYDDSDQMVPHAAYENLGQQSVSAALTQLREDLIAELTVPDTGWLDCSLSNNTSNASSSFITQARQIGNVVYIDGRMTRPSSADSQLWCTLPSGIARPRRTETLQSPSNQPSPAFAYVDGAGALRTATAISGAYSLHVNAFYVV